MVVVSLPQLHSRGGKSPASTLLSLSSSSSCPDSHPPPSEMRARWKLDRSVRLLRYIARQKRYVSLDPFIRTFFIHLAALSCIVILYLHSRNPLSPFSSRLSLLLWTLILQVCISFKLVYIYIFTRFSSSHLHTFFSVLSIPFTYNFFFFARFCVISGGFIRLYRL